MNDKQEVGTGLGKPNTFIFIDSFFVEISHNQVVLDLDLVQICKLLRSSMFSIIPYKSTTLAVARKHMQLISRKNYYITDHQQSNNQ
jgi:hypothetical protein